MKDLGDYIHNKGLWFGIYSSAGTKTCQKRPGSLGFEMQDAKNFTAWGVDYLKYDNCYNAGVAAQDRYTTMGNALKSTGRPVFYSLCNWGNEDVGTWGKTVAHSWRTTQDIEIYQSSQNQWQQLKANFLTNSMNADNAG